MTEEWGRPAEIGGEFVKPAQLNGHLVIIYPLGYIPFIQTRFSGQTNKPSDGIAVDVIDLDDKDEYGNPGKVYRNSNFMQAQLIAALKSQIGSKVLGVVSQGVARNGMNAPWVVIDMSGDAAARERAQAWLALNANFRPSPFVVRENRPPAPPAPPQQGYNSGGMTYPQMYGNAPQAPQQQPAQQFSSSQQQPQQPYVPPQQPPAQPQFQQPVQQNTPHYAPVQGSAPLTQEDMSVLQHYRAQRAAADADAQRQQQAAGFEDQPPF